MPGFIAHSLTMLDQTAKRQSRLSKFNPFSKKQNTQKDKIHATGTSEEQIEAERRNKELIMKYRNMTEEECDKYLQEKKKGDGMNAQRGLRALDMALAPAKMVT